MRLILLIALVISVLAACMDNPRRLPILGNRLVSPGGDTIYHQVPDFAFIDQDSQAVTNATFAGKIYVTDFFFTHCPTICPKVKVQAKRLYDRYQKEPRLAFLSHSIDVKNDTVGRLREYAQKMGISSARWHLVTGDHDAIYGIADDYFSVATEDPDAPGGFDHSGRLILVDHNRHVRAFCDGTDHEQVTRFMNDIDALLAEMDQEQPDK